MEISELKARKKALKITTADLAVYADLPVSTVSKIMTGETRKPNFITVERIDEALFRLEMENRIMAYKQALDEYLSQPENSDSKGADSKGADSKGADSKGVDSKEKNSKENDFKEKDFEAEYRRLHNLNDAPIPLAVEKGKTIHIPSGLQGSLALKREDPRLTIAEYQEFGEDTLSELIDGRVIYDNFPGLAHQETVQQIGKIIDQFISSNRGNCKVYNMGINVQLDEDDFTLVGPDIVVLCDSSKLTEQGILGAPDLVMEVVSKSSRKKDYHIKLHKYMNAGVREYWIVDLERKMITVCMNGEPMTTQIYNMLDEVPVGIFDGRLKVQLN